VRNDGDRPRRLSATYYAEWVLGTVRENAPLQVVCECDPESGAILARNAWAGDFAKKIAFAPVVHRPSLSPPIVRSFSGNTARFNGRRSEARRAVRPRGPGLDPCAAMTTEMTLAPGEAREVIFALGQADSLEEVHRLISEYTQSHRADAALTRCKRNGTAT
jgi:Cellobiose phosphorylase